MLVGTTTEDVAEARSGDRAALERLLMACFGALRGAVSRVIPDRMRGEVSEEDLVQEAVAEIVRSLPTLTSDDPRAFMKWARKIAKRRAINQIRQRLTAKRGGGAGAVQWVDGELLSGLLPMLTRSQRSPRSAMAHAEDLENLRLTLAELESEHRMVLHLRFAEQMPFEEIGKRVEKSGPAVQMIVFRALRRLRGMMPE